MVTRPNIALVSCLNLETVDSVLWKKRWKESEVEEAPVSLQPHDPGSFVPRALTDGLKGAL